MAPPPPPQARARALSLSLSLCLSLNQLSGSGSGSLGKVSLHSRHLPRMLQRRSCDHQHAIHVHVCHMLFLYV